MGEIKPWNGTRILVLAQPDLLTHLQSRKDHSILLKESASRNDGEGLFPLLAGVLYCQHCISQNAGKESHLASAGPVEYPWL